MSLQVRNQISGALERVAGFNDTDSILSPSSKNPISNKAVYNALLQKIDKTVTDLINYYDKSQVYTKPEVRALIGAINTLTIEVVSQLPTSEISTTTIYFVGPAAGTNTYDEYVYVGGNWVQIGDTTIDLSNYVTSANLTTVLQSYYTKSQTDALFDDYYDKDAVDDLLDAKQNTLTFDNTPTSGSSNPVTSTGIRTAINNAIVSSAGGSIIKVHHIAEAAAAGNTVTASKGDYSVSSTFDTSGDAIIIGFGEIGNITITATNGSETGSTVINIPNFSVYTARVGYGLDYKSWLMEGGLDPSYYDSLDEVLADEEVIRRLMTIHASVDYLAMLDKADDEMAIAVLNNDICAKWINLRDYALDTLYTNEYTKAIMDEADKYGYGEWALMPQVPTMTSNTATYGEVIRSGEIGTHEAFYAFDNNDSTYWQTNTFNGNYIGYKFVNPVCVKKIRFKNYETAYAANTVKVQASNDGNDWTDIQTLTMEVTKNPQYFDINNDKYYLYYRIAILTATSTVAAIVSSLQFYAWAPKGNIPIMTSATAPYGEASGNSATDATFAYYAFDNDETTLWTNGRQTTGWLQYKFMNPVCVKKVYLRPAYVSGLRLKTYTVQASNDGSTWADLFTETVENDQTLEQGFYRNITNDNYYLYYRISINSSYESGQRYADLYTLQFYGREMKVSVPAMTSNTTPYGEAFGDPAAYSTNYDFYRAFDKNSSTQAAYINGATQGYFGYDFGRKVAIKYAAIYQTQGTRPTTIIYSDDKVNWTDACSVYSHTANTTAFIKANDDAGEHRYWALRIVQNNNGNTPYIDFFGFDYSERDWDTEKPKHYLYDHGVKPNEILEFTTQGTGIYSEDDRSIILKKNTSSSSPNLAAVGINIDCTNYNLVRSIVDDYYSNSAGNTATMITASTILGDSDLGYYNYPVSGGTLPNHMAMSLSNINQTCYLNLRINSSVSDIGYSFNTEWWLE